MTSVGTIAKGQAVTRELDGYKLGYDQGNRWDIRPGGECDCSSICGEIAKRAGYPINLSGTFYTGNWAQRAKEAGFTILRWTKLADVREGDFIVSPGHHIEFAYTDKKWFSARNDERGKSTGGRSGNQGDNVGWGDPYDMSKGGKRTTYVCRPPDTELRKGDSGPAVAALQADLMKLGLGATVAASGGADGDFGSGTEAAVLALQEAAGIKEDAVVGPKTRAALAAAIAAQETPQPEPTPDPEPEPPVTPTAIDIRFGLAAQQAPQWSGPKGGTSVRGEALKSKLGASAYVLTEVPREDRSAIRRALGGVDDWGCNPIGYVAVLRDRTKFKHRGSTSVSFGTAYHGAVRSELVAGNGTALDVIGVHVRPSVATSPEGKQADIAKALTLFRKGVSTIVAGDFNTSHTQALKAAGLVRATPAVDTHDGAGDQLLDQVWVTPDLVVRYATKVNPGSVSDHSWWKVGLTIPAPVPTT